MTFIGDADDPATVLQESRDFFHKYFPGSDGDEADRLRDHFATSFSASSLPPYWPIGRLAAALVQMCDLVAPLDRTAGERFLRRLGRIAASLLDHRDDRRVFPESFRPVDPFRNRVMPAWGGHTRDRDGKWNTDVDTSGLFSYPMAAFARRVALNPRLHAEFGHHAIRLITATIETFEAFRPELHLTDSDPHAYFKVPLAYRHLECRDGGGCRNYRDLAGKPLPYNQNLSMMQALTELARAADSALYRGSADANPYRLLVATQEMPLVVAKNVAFFADHLRPGTLDDGSPYFVWDYQQAREAVEDTAHGQFELGCLAVILEGHAALDAMLARAGRSERLPRPRFFAPIANTFLRKVWRNNSLRGKVDGSGDPRSIECAGWVPYSQFDPWVWKRSRDTVATTEMREDNHAALLRYRKFGGMKYLTEFAGQNWLIVPAATAVGEPPPASIHDQRWLLVLSGVVLADHKGDHGDRWNRLTVSFMPDMAGPDDPGSTSGPLNWAIGHHAIPKPAGAPGAEYVIRFSLDAWSPSVSRSAIFNQGQAIDFGIAVDAWRPTPFATGIDALTGRPVGSLFAGINADLAARERNGWLFRLGYNITMTGRIVFVVPPF